jgi:hypothetical protein
MKKTLRMFGVLILIALISFLAGEALAAAFEFGDLMIPRVTITGNFTAAGNSSPVTLRNTYSRWQIYTSANGVAATAQTLTVQIAPLPANPAMTPVFSNAATLAGVGIGKTDTGTAIWTASIVRVNAVLTPGPTATVGATPGPTPASTDWTLIGTN